MKNEKPLSEKLKDLLDNMTQDEFDKDWKEIKKMNLSGPKLEEYNNFLLSLHNNLKK